MKVLACFAVREEARFFRAPAHCTVLLTAMGPAAAARNFQPALAQHRPDLVVTCGFAGALQPNLRVGDLVFMTDDASIGDKLKMAGAQPARFAESSRVATTRAEKLELRKATSADVVEMESGVIQRLCRQAGVRAVTLRVISDEAEEDLPLDFNQLMTEAGRLRFGALIWQVVTKPTRIGGLLRLQRRTALAARRLGEGLNSLLTNLG